MSASWNDMNDSSSISGASSDEEIAQIIQKHCSKNQKAETLPLQRGMSTPDTLGDVAKNKQKGKFVEKVGGENVANRNGKVKSKHSYQEKGSFQKQKQIQNNANKKKVKYVMKEAVQEVGVEKGNVVEAEKLEKVVEKDNEERSQSQENSSTHSPQKQKIQIIKVNEQKSSEKNEVKSKSTISENNHQNSEKNLRNNDEQNQDEPEGETEETQIKEKKKKKNKNKKKKDTFKDPNNPFSGFA